MKEIQNCKPDSPKYESIRDKTKDLSEQMENRLIRVNLRTKQIPEHMDVLEEIFSSFGVSTSDLEEPKPQPPKETAPAANQVEKPSKRVLLDIAVTSRKAMDKLRKSLSQADPSSEFAARIRS
ncbi:hypothetical protein CEXT_431131 [Caerostris extrusa]|uniref:Uncharacterized protein n=1 Tax=Caerostris extrusa TaxID=172846 RepID=A0AAV4TKI2_CAEEX|nr:hypothetical protein CEXT_431131 [Caerostris extrusa]